MNVTETPQRLALGPTFIKSIIRDVYKEEE